MIINAILILIGIGIITRGVIGVVKKTSSYKNYVKEAKERSLK